MIIRFQADADLNFLIVRKLLRREPDIDFQSVPHKRALPASATLKYWP